MYAPEPGPSRQVDHSVPCSQNTSEAEDQRFAELLKPIKDLTANWQVPLSQLLENYIEELSVLNVSIGRQGQTHKVNFIEAALLIQGTAAVYSKKVEFLWQNVLKMLDLLASQKALEELEGGEKPKKCGKRGHQQHDFSDFSAVSADMSRSINMKNSDDFNMRDRKANLNFIIVTPRQLIEKEGREQKNVTINLYAKNGAKDLIGHKEDFRVNSQFSLFSGTVGEELGLENDLLNQSVSLCEDNESFMETSLLQPSTQHETQQLEIIRNNSNEVCSTHEAPTCHEPVPDLFDDLRDTSFGHDHDYCNGSLMDVGNDDLDRRSDTASDGEDVQGRTRRSKRLRKNRLQELLNEPKAPLADPWEPIKPHEASNVVPKPIKKGKTCRAPSDVVLKRAVNNAKSTRRNARKNGEFNDGKRQAEVVVPVEQYLIHEVVTQKYSHLGRIHGIPPELKELAYEESKKKRRDNQDEPNGEEAEGIAPDEDHLLDHDYADNNWEECHFEGGTDQGECGRENLVEENDSHVAKTGAASSSAGGDDAYANKHEDGDSYEELVMKRVAEYVQQSQDYIESTDLAKKVARWHDDIRPRLESVEQRRNFDIHSYGSDILHAFPDDSRKTTVGFAQIVKGKDREEVCRYFLSSLMLANTYNVELGNEGVAEVPTTQKGDGMGSLPMDHVELTLLSRKMLHVVEEAPQFSPKKKLGKRIRK